MAKGFVLTPIIFIGILCIAFMIFIHISKINDIVSKGTIYESNIEKTSLEMLEREANIKSFALTSLLNASRFENSLEGLFNSSLSQLNNKFGEIFNIRNLTSTDPLNILLEIKKFSLSNSGVSLTSPDKNITLIFNYPFINFTKTEARFNKTLFCGNCTKLFDCNLYINNFTLYGIPEFNIGVNYIYFGDDTSYVWFYSDNNLTNLDTSTCGSNYDSGCMYPHYIFNKNRINCSI